MDFNSTGRKAFIGFFAVVGLILSLWATGVKAEVRIVAVGDSAIKGHGVSANETYLPNLRLLY